MAEKLVEEKRRITTTAMGGVINDPRTVDVDEPFLVDGELTQASSRPKLLQVENVPGFGTLTGVVEGVADSHQGIPVCAINTTSEIEPGKEQRQRFYIVGQHVHLQAGEYDTVAEAFTEETWLAGDDLETAKEINRRLTATLAAVAPTQ